MKEKRENLSSVLRRGSSVPFVATVLENGEEKDRGRGKDRKEREGTSEEARGDRERETRGERRPRSWKPILRRYRGASVSRAVITRPVDMRPLHSRIIAITFAYVTRTEPMPCRRYRNRAVRGLLGRRRDQRCARKLNEFVANRRVVHYAKAHRGSSRLVARAWFLGSNSSRSLSRRFSLRSRRRFDFAKLDR